MLQRQGASLAVSLQVTYIERDHACTLVVAYKLRPGHAIDAYALITRFLLLRAHCIGFMLGTRNSVQDIGVLSAAKVVRPSTTMRCAVEQSLRRSKEDNSHHQLQIVILQQSSAILAFR